jgi:glucan phosphoethanolaminetransferase (alkaline phosphatase superfamily)
MNLDPSKWYFRTYAFVAAFLCVGPLALILVWINPRYKRSKKIFITIITLLVCYAVFALLVKSTESIYNYYNQMLQLQQ